MRNVAFFFAVLMLVGAGCASQNDTAMEADTMMERDVMMEERDAMDDGNMMEQDNPTMETSGDVNVQVEIVDEETMAEAPLKEFNLTAQRYSYSKREIRVNEGDKVRITVDSIDGTHDLVIDEFNVETATLAQGATDTVEFIATKTGEFEYYCSVGNHRSLGMIGTLIVE